MTKVYVTFVTVSIIEWEIMSYYKKKRIHMYQCLQTLSDLFHFFEKKVIDICERHRTEHTRVSLSRWDLKHIQHPFPFLCQ